MSKWYIETNKEVYIVEAEESLDVFIKLAEQLPMENAGILMIASSEPFDIGEKDDDLLMLSAKAYQMAGVISEEEYDDLMQTVFSRVKNGFEDENE